MSTCASIDSLVTPYVDGELSAGDRARVDEHLHRCPPCYSRVRAEGAVRALVRAGQPVLTSECASAQLHARCGSVLRAPATHVSTRGGVTASMSAERRPWRVPLAPFALAASLVLLVGGAFVYQATDQSALVMAAELAADHVKCFAANELLGTHDEPADVERAMLSSFGWRLHMPEQVTDAGMELVGARRCLYGEGKIAHIMYRQQGRPVSVFMLPKTARPEEIVDVLGHEAAIWSEGERTFVLVTSGPRWEVQHMAQVVRASLH
jgi:anti-sigma factor RsiW